MNGTRRLSFFFGCDDSSTPMIQYDFNIQINQYMSKAYLSSNSNQTKHICFILNVIHIILLSLDSPSQFIFMLLPLGDDLSATFTQNWKSLELFILS